MREAFFNRLKKNSDHRAKWARTMNVAAYRLYHHDIPEYPFIIDRYGPYIIVWNRLSEEIDAKLIIDLPELKNEMREFFAIAEDLLIWKERKVQKRDERYQKLGISEDFVKMNEGDRYFLCNLWDYVDTGLFLDMRSQRDLIEKKLKPKNMLNLFSYTCSVGVAAALGGAKTTNVDLSNTYLDWGIENYRINNLDLENHQFLAGPCEEFVEQKPTDHYDLIFLDPPTFSNSKRMKSDFDIVVDHPKLIENTIRWLSKDGVLLFSTNKKKFKLEEYLLHKYDVKETTHLTIPEDFKNSSIHKSYELRLLKN